MLCLDDDLILWFTKTINKTSRINSNRFSVIRSKINAPHFDWGNGCHGWWLKDDSNFTVITEQMPPYSSEKKHYHHKTEQYFYCLSGTLLIEIENQVYTLSLNEGITIYAGQAHKVKNVSDEESTFLVISMPNSHDDRKDLE